MAKATKEQKAAWEKDKQNLAAARDRLGANLKEIGNDMKDSWEEFAANTRKTMKEVGEKLNQ